MFLYTHKTHMGTGLIETETLFTTNVKSLLYFQRIGEICSHATWTGLGSSQGFRSERPATNRLSHCSEFCRKLFLELIRFKFLKSRCGQG